MNIGILAAGAGGMYCGSCMRDNALAGALKRAGHQVTLIPLYTPLRTEQNADMSHPEVFFGGVNVYLQHATRIFRHTPRMLDWIFDRPWILNAAGKMGAQTSPQKLAGLTQSVLEGEDGPARKELGRLVDFLRDVVKPQVVSLPNLMFVGMARTLHRALGVPVVCELTGEDIFLDAMSEEDRTRLRDLIRARAGDVARFVATSDHYAARMADYLDISREKIDVVHNGLSPIYLREARSSAAADHPPTIGYLARICPEKGLGRLVDAIEILIQMPDMKNVQVKVAGYLGQRDQKWYTALQQRMRDRGLSKSFIWLGELDLEAKIQMLDSLDVFTVPTAYPEAKGIYVLEAMARGVPVVQPAHGSFPELIDQTGGGVLVPPGDAQALANGLAELLRDRAKPQALGRAGRAAVESAFTEDHMAANMLEVFHSVLPDQTTAIAQP